METNPVLFLRSDELQGLAGPESYVDAVREGYRQRGEGAPARPRSTLANDDPAGILTGYTSILPETGAMGGYTYAAGFGAGDAHFVLPLFDAESGALIALLDGASINPLKTGAAGAVGVDALARQDARTLGVIGSGAQARGQVLATATARDFDSVRVFSPTPSNREAFADAMDERLEASVTAVEDSTAAVSESDVVVTATRATEPVFASEDLPDGAHVTAMGQYNETARELDADTVARATYVPDLTARLAQDAGAYIQARDAGVIDEGHAHAELGEVVAGTAPGRTAPDDVTVFDSGGTGIETVAAAHMLYQRAREQGLGETIEFAPASEAMPGR